MNNAGFAHAFESLFGPPSELIDVKAFLDATRALELNEPMANGDVADECSVESVHNGIQSLWNNPILSATLVKDHEHAMTVLQMAASSKATRKAPAMATQTTQGEKGDLQKNLKAVPLPSFRLPTDAKFFVRTCKNSDYNVLQNVKTWSTGPNSLSATFDPHQALITVSLYSKVLWGPSYVTRLSQHSLLSSQTLQDLHDVTPCPFNGLREEPSQAKGFVFCIEDAAYGDGRTQDDYGSKVLLHLSATQKPVPKAAVPARDMTFGSLSLRLHLPYWFIHQGNCEHFVVFDEIRLLHSSDPRTGYPLTLQVTPALRDLCRACLKVPAVLAVIGDVRLGESPCVLCQPCWKMMGEPDNEEVEVIPILSG